PRGPPPGAAGPPAEDVAQAPVPPVTPAAASTGAASTGPASSGAASSGGASSGPAGTGSAGTGSSVSTPTTPAVVSSPAVTPMVAPAPTAASGSGTVPQATFQPPP